MYACQAVYQGRTLPRKVIDCENLHDAMRIYCEAVNVPEDELFLSPSRFADGYWIEHQEAPWEQTWDLQGV